MDIFDMATAVEERDRALAIQAARKPVVSAKANGRCLNCNAQLEKGSRWCDGDCRDDWELDQLSKRAR